MKLRDWFRMKKQKREERRREKLARKLGNAAEAPAPEAEELEAAEAEAEEAVERRIEAAPEPLDFDPADINAPESRFTEEYGEFIKEQAPLRESDAVRLGSQNACDDR